MTATLTTQQAKRQRGRPRTGRAQSAAERMRAYRARQRESGLRAVTRYESPASLFNAGALKHRIIEMRSLAMHCVAAQKIERDPKLLKTVSATLESWRARYGEQHTPQALNEWAEILRKPWPAIAALITSPSEDATRLRQSTPFASVLTPEEREHVYAAFRA